MGLFLLVSLADLIEHRRLVLTQLLCAAGALLGVAVVAWKWRGDTGPAAAMAAVLLPGLLLLRRANHVVRGTDQPPSNVPAAAFYLAAAAPLALAPLLLPILARQERWKRWIPGILLPLIPAAVAVILAAQNESLTAAEEEY